MEETRRMSTAATAAYQAAQVESGIGLSAEESSTRNSRRDGETRRKRMLRGEIARGEETAPKHPCVYTLARSRVFLIHRGNACTFHLVFAPSRERSRETLARPSRFSCASVIMCSHIGVPGEKRRGGGGWARVA